MRLLVRHVVLHDRLGITRMVPVYTRRSRRAPMPSG